MQSMQQATQIAKAVLLGVDHQTLIDDNGQEDTDLQLKTMMATIGPHTSALEKHLARIYQVHQIMMQAN